MIRPLLLLLAPLFCLGCGLTSPGGGTRTLFVTARLTSDGSTSGSRARVTVRAGSASGDIVKDAEVAIRGGKLGRTIVSYDDARAQYQLDGLTWVEGFRLEVVRGTDMLDGSIEAPGASLIVQPISDSTYRRADGAPLVVRWKDERGAIATSTQVRLDKAKIDRAVPPGAFELRFDPSELRVDNKERVRLERSNEVSLAGGAVGSTLSATTEHSIEFRVE